MSETEAQKRDDSLIGLTVDHGRYEIISLIGEGGMGRVFKARQISMNRMVALKVLRAHLASDEHLLARFQQEAESVAKLRHPNTITVHDYGRTEDGYLFISMELLGGRPLASVLRDETRLPLGRALKIMEQVVGAVAEAHEGGVVHRDLKPENIQIDKVGADVNFAKVLDFGIAKIVQGEDDAEERKTLTMAGAVFGTPHYMSPEQVHGLKVDHRTDVYSLGIILYELLSGKPPFEGATPMAVMMAQAQKAPPDIRDACPEADVTDTVAELINSCLKKDRDERLGSATELLEVIRQARYELGDATGSGQLMLDPAVAKAVEGAKIRNRSSKSSLPPGGSKPVATAVSAVTPEHSGQISTRPPIVVEITSQADLEDDLPRPSGGAGKWVALAILLIGAGAGTYVWQTRSVVPADEKATRRAVDKPVRVEIKATHVRYTIDSEPEGAAVLLAGEEVGKTPFEYKALAGETPALTLQLDGHQDAELFLPGEAPGAPLKVKLEPLPMARFRLLSTPSGAQVFKGEDPVCITPCDWKSAASDAKVELRFDLDGFEPATHEVLLVAVDDIQPIEIELKARPKGKWRPRPQPRGERIPAPPPKGGPTPGGDSTPPEKKPPEKKPPSPYEKL